MNEKYNTLSSKKKQFDNKTSNLFKQTSNILY